MDLTYPPEAEEFRERVQRFLADSLPEGWTGLGALPPDDQAEFQRNWRQRLLDNELLGVTVPAEYGGAGLTLVEQAVLTEEFVRVGVSVLPHPNDNFGFNLLVPTLLQYGTEKQKAFFLPRTLSGEIRWAQGYSEPDAGSDLFNLRTRATVSGGDLVINGQKIWQTAGLTANWLFTMVRTDPGAERAKGLSFVLVPLDQPGVELRGIRNITGVTELAEVFLTDAVTSLDNVLGGLGNGARVALTLLGFERGISGVANAEAFAIELRRLVQLAHARGRSADRDIRLRIAHCQVKVHTLRCVALRALSAGLRGGPPGPESSLTKALTAEYHQLVTELAVEVLGMAALAPTGPGAYDTLKAQPLGLDSASSAAWVEDYLNARSRTIYGGSSEIQRNTIAEQILGMPREPRPAAAR
ncbi:acyl-CoA dehydrogenase family protein [Blastococcus sp. URHD0036]|uniref:acyl-CoA dehydrogenase family protein n=1 Tax=Blastococcus sp. URHD0036 TaxID=1380356 RepID=UPI0004968DB9|nr:acyl-CoA dehydrogenase family protein [Blastococcus sp. URHD0036]